MATTNVIATNGTDLASSAGTWDNGVPVDGDTITFPAGTDFVWDLDLTGGASGIIFGANNNGTMRLCRTTGSYGFVLNSHIAGSGVIDSGGAYPTDCQFDIIYKASAEFALSGAQAIECAEATINSCFTKAEYAATTTKIYVVDADDAVARIDLDAEWKANYYVRVDNAATRVSEEFAIVNTGNDGGGSYVTLDAGLAATKVIGSKVSLISRNIMLTGVTDAGTYGLNGVTGSVLSLGVRNFHRGLNGCNTNTITTCSPSGCSTGLRDCHANTITTCSPSGCTYGLYLCHANTITTCSPSGCTYGLYLCHANTITTCSPSGCSTGLYQCVANTITTCSPSGCSSGLIYCDANTIGGGAFGGNSYHFRRVRQVLATGLTFGTGTKWHECTSAYTGHTYNEVANDGGVAGALSARTAGGETARATGSGNFTHTCEDAAYPAYRQIVYAVPTGTTVLAALVGTMSDASMTAGLQLLMHYGGAVLDSDSFVGNTNEQNLSVSWANTTGATVYVVMRVSAMYSSGTLAEVTESGVAVGLELDEVESGVTWIDYDGEKTGTLSGGGGVTPLIRPIIIGS